MTPKKIEQCKTEIQLVAQVLMGIIEDMDVENPYITVSAQKTENCGLFWSFGIHGNDKVIARVDSEGVDGAFEEVCGNGNI